MWSVVPGAGPELGVSYPHSLAAGVPRVNVASTERTKHKFYIQNPHPTSLTQPLNGRKDSF